MLYYLFLINEFHYFRYLYGDLYAGAIWAGTEEPENSGNFTTNKIPFSCAHDSPLKCGSVPGTSQSDLGYIFSFGEDNKKDLYILANTGVYRIVAPSRCSYKCSLEKATTTTNTTSQSPSPSSPSHGDHNWSTFSCYFCWVLCCMLWSLWIM